MPSACTVTSYLCQCSAIFSKHGERVIDSIDRPATFLKLWSGLGKECYFNLQVRVKIGGNHFSCKEKSSPPPSALSLQFRVLSILWRIFETNPVLNVKNSPQNEGPRPHRRIGLLKIYCRECTLASELARPSLAVWQYGLVWPRWPSGFGEQSRRGGP